MAISHLREELQALANIRKYLRHDVVIERRTRDSSGNPVLTVTGENTWDEPFSTRARKVEAEGERITSTGEEVDVETEVMLGPEDVVYPGDLIDGEEIGRVEWQRDRIGRVVGYWCYL